MKIVLILFLLFVGACAAAGWILFPRMMAVAPKSYQTAKVDRGVLTILVSATGSVEPTLTVKVGSQVSGRVKEVKVEDDQRVKAGETLALLDTELLENERNDREIQLRQARSSLALLRIESDGLALKEERVAQSLDRDKIARARCQAALELAQKTLQRYDELVKHEATPQSEYDIRRLEKENAERDLRLKELDAIGFGTDLKDIQNSRQNLAARVAQTEIAVEQAKEALKRSATNLGYAQILSPIDGVVLEKTVEKGQTIAAQFQTPDLFKIAADLKVVNVRALIDEIDISRVHFGQEVSFEVDAFRGEKFKGKVAKLHLKHESKANLVSYPVVVEADNPPSADYPLGKLRPGMTAYLDFEVRNVKDTLRLPAAALHFAPISDAAAAKEVKKDAESSEPDAPSEPSKKESEPAVKAGAWSTVYVKDAAGKPKPLRVRVGDSDGKFYELLSAELKAGDEVITGETAPPVPAP